VKHVKDEGKKNVKKMKITTLKPMMPDIHVTKPV
jgi:hypothetical protein